MPQALLIAFRDKERTGDSTTSAELTVPPPALQERFKRLVQDAGSAVRSGRVALQVPLPGRRDEPAAAAAAASSPDLGKEPEPVEVPLTTDNVAAVEGIFDTSVGANVENEQLCRFLLAATAPA